MLSSSLLHGITPTSLLLMVFSRMFPLSSVTGFLGVLPCILAGLEISLSMASRGPNHYFLGNSVILKHSPQTFPCAERFAKAFEEAGLPQGVFQVSTAFPFFHSNSNHQYIHCDHDVAQTILRHPAVAHVQFTGSIRGGFQVIKSLSEKISGMFLI